MKKTFKIAGILSVIVLFVMIGLYAYLHFIVFEDPFDNKTFERSVWIKNQNNMNPDNPRGEMYKDLVENKLKIGMTKDEIIALFGKADFKTEKRFLSYNLGMWSGFRMDYDSLDLEFDDQNQLKQFYRVQH